VAILERSNAMPRDGAITFGEDLTKSLRNRYTVSAIRSKAKTSTLLCLHSFARFRHLLSNQCRTVPGAVYFWWWCWWRLSFRAKRNSWLKCKARTWRVSQAVHRCRLSRASARPIHRWVLGTGSDSPRCKTARQLPPQLVGRQVRRSRERCR